MTAWIAALLLFTATLVAVAFHALENAAGAALDVRDRAEQEVYLSRQSDQIVRRLAQDRTPFADSPHDQVWSYLRELSRSNIDATLQDLSWLPGECPFVDVGLAPVPAMEELFRQHGVDPRRARLAAAAIDAKRLTGSLDSVSNLSEWLGASAGALRSILRAEPLTNVNLAPERAIRLALAGQFGAPETASRVLASLLSRRRASEIDERTLELLLSAEPPAKGQPLGLGVRTWTWRLTLSSGNALLVRILARVDRSSDKGFVSIGRRFQHLRPSGNAPRSTGAAHVR